MVPQLETVLRETTRPRLSLRSRNALVGIAFVLPTTLGLIVFYWYPLVSVFSYSFQSWNLMGQASWVGAQNFQQILGDPNFYTGIRNTIVYILLFLPASLLIGFLLAVGLNRRFSGRILLRTAYFMPYVSMSVAVSLVWKWIYQPTYGLLNYLLKLIGLPTPSWLLDSHTVLISLAIMAVWQTVGYNMLFYLAALQNVPKHLIESSDLDGANTWQKIKHIVLPLVSPTTFFLVVLNTIGGFQVFDQIYVMTNGGPGESSTTIVYYMYNTGFTNFQIGPASAVSVILFLILICITALNFWGQKRWVHYES